MKKSYIISAIIFVSLFASSCGFITSAVENVTTMVGLNDAGTVIAQRAQIRSSYAVVAADLLEVQRGDKLQILEETDFEKVKWYRVRASDEEETEGWIEAQNVILGEILEKSKKLADEFKDSQPQANGQLRAASNLRLTAEQTDDNILLKLDPASTFEIISWKYVPKAQNDADSNTNSASNPELAPAKEENEPDKLLDKYDVWYFVKLNRSVSPAPAGWLFGRQVELQVPSDIVYYQQNDKKFVTWQRIDEVADDNLPTKPTDAVQVSHPGSWVV
ncbi:MAG: SH3 domain-containing protein, partial [Pyrinomonadaceae bacterium]